MIVDKILQYLSAEKQTFPEALVYSFEKMIGHSLKRQFGLTEEKDSVGKLYMSSAGKCPRQLAYGFHGFEAAGKEIDSRAKLTFFLGDVIEATAVALAVAAGVKLQATGFNQMRVTHDIDGFEISGYPDGISFHEHEWFVAEFKSMADFQFKKFESGELDQGYRVQTNLYMGAVAMERACIVAVNKNSAIMGEMIIEKDPELILWAKKNLRSVITSTKEALPAPPEDLNFNPKTRLYPWNCLYCGYWKLCRTNAEKVLVSKAYKLREKGTPGKGEKNGN